MTKDQVLVVVPNYNGGKIVLECIQSILKQTYPHIELVVVDNASTDGSRAEIEKTFPQLRIIDSGYNAGWGIACNIGMKASESEYIVLVNNDAVLDPHCVEEMVKVVTSDKRCGSVASRILLMDKPDTIEVCGLVIYRDGFSCGRGRLESANRYLEAEEVFCANDCCCLYRREMINDIGDYDPDFFIYCDETDIGWRHQLAGWKCLYTPKAVAYHAHSRAAGSYSSFKAYHVERNRLFICFKCFPLDCLLLSFVFSGCRYVFQIYLSLISKRGALAQFCKSHGLLEGAQILFRAHRDAFQKLPVMWARRGSIRRSMRINRKQFWELFKRYGISLRAAGAYE